MNSFGSVRVLVVVSLVVLVAGCTSKAEGTHGSVSTVSPGTGSTTSASYSDLRLPDPDRRPLPPSQAAALKAALDQVVALEASIPGSGVPGLTASVLTDHGAWTGAAGRDGAGTPLRPNAMMLIASITKTFLAAEVLRLVDTGQVDLDAPLSRYVDHALAANGATVRQTLSMRGGFRDNPDADLDRAMAHAAASPRHHSTVSEAVTAWSAPSTTPGDPPVYSNTGYLLLGMLVEHVMHRPVARALRTDLFAPAGLERIAAQDAERPIPPLAAPRPELRVTSRDGYLPCRSLASLGNDSSSGVAADAATVATWGYQLYGGRVLPARLTALMQTAPSAASIFPGISYGMGTMLFEGVTTDAAAGHEGSLAHYTSVLVVVPARHLSIAVLADGDMPDSRLIVRQLLDALA